MVGGFLGLRVASEGNGGWLEVDFKLTLRDIRSGDREVDYIFLCGGGGGALSPSDWMNKSALLLPRYQDFLGEDGKGQLYTFGRLSGSHV